MTFERGKRQKKKENEGFSCTLTSLNWGREGTKFFTRGEKSEQGKLGVTLSGVGPGPTELKPS